MSSSRSISSSTISSCSGSTSSSSSGSMPRSAIRSSWLAGSPSNSSAMLLRSSRLKVTTSSSPWSGHPHISSSSAAANGGSSKAPSPSSDPTAIPAPNIPSGVSSSSSSRRLSTTFFTSLLYFSKMVVSAFLSAAARSSWASIIACSKSDGIPESSCWEHLFRHK